MASGGARIKLSPKLVPVRALYVAALAIPLEAAMSRGKAPLQRFMLAQTRDEDLATMYRVSRTQASSAIEQLAELVTELAFGLMLAAEERAAPNAISGGPENGFDSLAWRETQVVLHRRVTELPEPERSVVRQHYQHDLPFAEIADLLGLSRGRISQLHKSALGKLRKSMRSVR
jgi:RNA polymerase sigma factor for flagellar operon FliA